MFEQLTINEQSPIIARHYDYERFTYPWHFHSEYEIIYVEEGMGERFVADSMEPFSPGDLILMGSNVPHYMRSAEKYYAGNASLRVRGVVIQFAHDYMTHTISRYADMTPVKRLLEESQRGLHFPSPDNKDLIKCINNLPTNKGVERITNLLLLLDKMANFPSKRILGSLHFSSKPSQSADSRSKKALSYITGHYTENIRLEAVAAIVSMNKSAFCRYLKEKTGRSYIEYVQSLRIGYACKLLISTSYDILQISMECGFNTVCHFNKMFKRNTGLTPSEYRKQFLKL
jgi:AraC-like DNA-binding protein